MPRNNTIGNLALVGYDDIFKSSTAPISGESIVEIPLSELHPPEFHPFHVFDDAKMTRLTFNIQRNGVREPGLARPRIEGGYELLCGNRRKRACERAEFETMPVIIRDMDDYSAALAMVDSNLEHRETLLYSEKAWACKIALTALNTKYFSHLDLSFLFYLFGFLFLRSPLFSAFHAFICVYCIFNAC